MKIGPKYAALAVLLLVLGAVPALTGRGEEAAPKEKKRTSPAGVIVNPAEEGLAARCPICGDFLYKHNNPDYPDFRCIPPNADKRGIPETRRMVCPVCFAVNKVKFVRRLDFSRGIDSDLCYHSGKPSDYMTNIYTCPYCGYTAFADGFYELPPGKAAPNEYDSGDGSHAHSSDEEKYLDVLREVLAGGDLERDLRVGPGELLLSGLLPRSSGHPG